MSISWVQKTSMSANVAVIQKEQTFKPWLDKVLIRTTKGVLGHNKYYRS